MSSSLRWFHQCVAIVANKVYRCNRCQLEFDLQGAIVHVVLNQSDLTSEQP